MCCKRMKLGRSRTAAIGEITRLSDTQVMVTAPTSGALYNWNLGDLVYMSFFFDGVLERSKPFSVKLQEQVQQQE